MGAFTIPMMGQQAPIETGLSSQNQLALLRARNLQNQLSEQAVQQGQIQQKLQQQQVQDQQTYVQALKDSNYDSDKALAAVQDKISPSSYMALSDKLFEHKKALATMQKDAFDREKDTSSRINAVYDQMSALDPDEYGKQWPNFAATLNKIKPDLNLDPTSPIPREQLEAHGIGLKTQEDLIKKAEEMRATQEAADKHGKSVSENTQGNLATIAQTLSGANNQQDWTQRLGFLKNRLPADVMAQIPEQYSPEAAESVRRMGMTPQQEAQTPFEKLTYQDWLAKPENKGKNRADFDKWQKSLTPLLNFNLAGGATGGLDQATIDQQAEKYYQTGQLPPVGRNAAGLAFTRLLMSRANQLHPGESLAEGSAGFKANADSLKNLQKTFDNVTAFEKTAGQNLDVFLNQAKKVTDLGIPIANIPARYLANKLGGADQAAFNAARTTALTEIAKVLSSANAGSGVLSDSARHEVEGLIGPDATLPQIVSAANILKQDMANRHESYSEQIDAIKGRMGGKSSGNTSGGNTSGAVQIPAGARTATGPNGHKIFVQDGKWIDSVTGKPL